VDGFVWSIYVCGVHVFVEYVCVCVCSLWKFYYDVWTRGVCVWSICV